MGSDRSALHTLFPETILASRYRILGLLGQGGMSRVYLAEDTRLHVHVAVKENLQAEPEARAQFEHEVRILAHLSHPNLPRVIDHFTDRYTGRQYLVMEYIEGEDLGSLVRRRGPLPEKVALNWIGQVLDALAYLHGQRPPVIHRDVKPANIKVTPEGRAVLVDFGIAKAGGAGVMTLTGARGLTPGYAPPEQYGLRTSERSDIYSVGATLYTLLTGQVPPEAPLRVAGKRLVPPRQVVSSISRSTEAALLRALGVETGKRWKSVQAFRRALSGEGSLRVHPVALVVAAIALFVIGIWVALSNDNNHGSTAVSPTSPASGTTRNTEPTSLPSTWTPMPTPTSSGTEVTLEPTWTPTRSPSPTETPSPMPNPVAVVQGDRVNVRAGPGTGYPRIGQVVKGTKLQIIAQNGDGDWLLLCCVDGLEGWIAAELVSTSGVLGRIPVVTPSPPPLGDVLAFVSERTGLPQVHIVNLRTGELWQVTTVGRSMQPMWGLGNTQLYYLSDRDGALALYETDPWGSYHRRISPVGVTSAVVSPTGRVAYAMENRVYIDDVAVSSEAGEVFVAGWSRASELMVYLVNNGDNNWSLGVVGSDMRGRILRGPEPGLRNPAISADGRQIAYVTNVSGVSQLHLIQTQDGADVTISPPNYWLQLPAWIPGHNLLSFVTEQGGQWHIKTMEPTGRNWQHLASGVEPGSYYVWAPGGGRVAYVRANWEVIVLDYPQGTAWNVSNHRAKDSQPAWPW